MCINAIFPQVFKFAILLSATANCLLRKILFVLLKSTARPTVVCQNLDLPVAYGSATILLLVFYTSYGIISESWQNCSRFMSKMFGSWLEIL